MKKVVSLFLCVVMAFSFVTPVFAGKVGDIMGDIGSNVQTTTESLIKIAELSAKAANNLQPVIFDMLLDSDNWEKASDYMMKIVVKLFDKIIPDPSKPPVDDPGSSDDPDNPDNPDSSEIPDVPDVPSLPNLPSISDVLKGLSVRNLVEIMQTYFIINMEDIDAASRDIIDFAEYKYVTTENGTTTVYIMVDIQKHPELLNRNLLMETVKGLYEKQNLEFNENADILMSYEHIAGELALHAILYAVTNEYLKITGETEGTIYNLWVRAKQADLNFDESRFPLELIEIVGVYIMGVIIVNVYSIFKIIKG